MIAAGQMALPLEPPRPASHPARRGDPLGSHQAAVDVTTSGRRDAECAVVLEAVRRFPGRTSHELARDAEPLGSLRLGQELDAWRYTLARRLPELEDGGLVCAVAPSCSSRRPLRSVDPRLAPCTVARKRAMRWWAS